MIDAHASLTAYYASDDAYAEDRLYWFLVLTPVWWMTGLLVPMALVGTSYFFFRRPPRDATIFVLVVLWCLVGWAQMLSAFINSTLAGDGLGRMLPHILTMPALGWILLGMAIGVGAEYRLMTPRIVRAVCIYGLMVLIFGVFSLGYSEATGVDELTVMTPLGMLLPGSMPSVLQHFTMQFMVTDDVSGIRRLILFYPWATGLAIGAMLVIIVAWIEPVRHWRWIGITGGLVALIGGQSRAAFIALFVAILLIAVLRMRGLNRMILAAVSIAVVMAALLGGFDPVKTFDQTFTEVNDLREGSSDARKLIYDESWAAFLTSPVFGLGWVGEDYSPEIPIPIGSHSTFYGMLYTSGVVGFGLFVLAYLATLMVMVIRLPSTGFNGAAAVGLWVALGIIAYGEVLSSLVPSCLITFLFTGASMNRRDNFG